MRTCSLLFLVICAIASPACYSLPGQGGTDATSSTKPAAADTLGPIAMEFVQSLAKGDYAKAEGYLNGIMKAGMPAPQLKTLWEGLVTECGPFQGLPAARQVKENLYDMVFVTCRFEKASLDLKVVFDNDRKVAGLWKERSREQVANDPPAYSDPNTFTETEVIVGTGQWKLPGTLSMPNGKGPFPAVVLVHGSGPNDRDEAIGPNKPFRDLAWGLATRGIAVLRYEKRTKEYQAKVQGDMTLTVKQETIDDALAAVVLLRQAKGIDARRIFVLGHSLGGMLAPRIAKADPTIAGLVIFAGLARPLDDTIVAQVRYLLSLDGPPTGAGKAQIEQTVAAAAKVNALTSAKAASKDLLLGIPASYWLDLRGYEPARMARDLPQPMLILQGGRDYQVTAEDLALWKKALADRPTVQIKTYPQMSHLFIAGTGKATPTDYEKPGHVEAEVINDIAAWIKAQR